MFGTPCRNSGQQGPLDSPAEDKHCSDGQWCHIISFKSLKFFSPFVYQIYICQPAYVEERQLPKPEPHTGSVGMNKGMLCAASSHAYIYMINQLVIPRHIQGIFCLKYSSSPLPIFT